MKPIEVNSLPDRRSAVALKLSQFLYRFGRKHRHSSRPRHISLAPPSPRSIISVSSHLAIRQIPRSFVADPPLPLSPSSIPRDTVQSSNPMKARPRSSSSTPLLLLVAITCQPSNSARTSWFPPILSRACAHQPP